MKSKKTFVVLALGLLSSVSACSSSTLSEPRIDATATLLPDGGVLVVGGAQTTAFLWMSGTKTQASAERYDPESGTWTPTGSMAAGRYHHTATALPSGKVLVAGGFSRGTGNNTIMSTWTAELYDPESGTWSPTGPMARGRIGHTATLLADGRVLVTGGSHDSTVGATTEVYDPAKGVWFPLASMGTARSGHSATSLPDGRILVAGGVNETSVSFDTAEVYDPAANTWSPTGSMIGSRAGHVATPLPNGKVLVMGGRSNGTHAEVYDPAAGTWTSVGGQYGGTLEAHTATSLPDGRVLVAGGYGPQGPVATVAVYVPETHSWRPSSPLPEPRTGHSAVSLHDGRVLVVGGYTHGKDGPYTPLDTSVTYDPDTDTWK